jgi:plastocyanin
VNKGLSRQARTLPAILIMLVLSAAIVACGATRGGREARRGGEVNEFATDIVEQKVEVVAAPTGEFKWTQLEYRATAGDVTFVVSNPSFVNHNFSVQGNGVNVESEEFGENQTKNYTLNGLQPGEYQIICTVPGHAEGGMISKLIVT